MKTNRSASGKTEEAAKRTNVKTEVQNPLKPAAVIGQEAGDNLSQEAMPPGYTRNPLQLKKTSDNPFGQKQTRQNPLAFRQNNQNPLRPIIYNNPFQRKQPPESETFQNQRENSIPSVSTENGIVQLKEITAADAITQAENQYTATPINRKAKTDDYINIADEGTTKRDWKAKRSPGVFFWASDSLSNGGSDRPHSIDLTVKPNPSSDADFIFHLPSLNGMPGVIDYLKDNGSGGGTNLKNTTAKIDEISRMNLDALTAQDVTKITDAQPVNRTYLKGNPFYQHNKAEIKTYDPNFMIDIKQQETDKNKFLNDTRTDPRYINRFQELNAISAKQRYTPLFNRVQSLLQISTNAPVDLNNLRGISTLVSNLTKEYEIAKSIFTPPETENYEKVIAKFEQCQQIEKDVTDLMPELNNYLNRVQATNIVTPEEYNAAVSTYKLLGERANAVKPYLGAQKAAINQVLKSIRLTLESKQPNTNKKREREKDEETAEPENKK